MNEFVGFLNPYPRFIRNPYFKTQFECSIMAFDLFRKLSPMTRTTKKQYEQLLMYSYYFLFLNEESKETFWRIFDNIRSTICCKEGFILKVLQLCRYVCKRMNCLNKRDLDMDNLRRKFLIVRLRRSRTCQRNDMSTTINL